MNPPKPPHHTDDGRFRNPAGSPRANPSPQTRRAFFRRRWSERGAMPEIPPDHVLPKQAVLDGLADQDGRDSLTWLGHACFLIRIDGLTLLTDPYLGETAGPVGFGPRRYVPPALGVDELPAIDAVLISHNHYDHLDDPTIRALAGRNPGAGILPLKLGDFLRKRGFATVHELDWYDSIALGRTRIALTPAVHFSRRGPFDRNKSLWGGFAIHGSAQCVFFSGDTGYGPVFSEIGARLGPFDTAIVGIGAYEPRAIMKASHTTPEEAVRLAGDLGARRIVAMHWGTVVLTDEPQFEPPERFRAAAEAAGHGPDTAWVMKIGETRALAAWPRN